MLDLVASHKWYRKGGKKGANKSIAYKAIDEREKLSEKERERKRIESDDATLISVRIATNSTMQTIAHLMSDRKVHFISFILK